MLKIGSYPIWDSIDGFFQPFNIKTTPLFEEIKSEISSITLPISSSLYMRGSLTEELYPHPKSDVDIILIDTRNQTEIISNTIREKLAYLNRPIEINPLKMQEINSSQLYRLLLQTRATHISGRKIDFKPVAADLETMKNHYYTYLAFTLNDVLKSTIQRRVCELKQLTRSFGIVNFLLHGQFSRDIFTCIQWAKRIDQEAGSQLESFWYQIDQNTHIPNMDIRYIKEKLWYYSNEGVKMYKRNL